MKTEVLVEVLANVSTDEDWGIWLKYWLTFPLMKTGVLVEVLANVSTDEGRGIWLKCWPPKTLRLVFGTILFDSASHSFRMKEAVGEGDEIFHYFLLVFFVLF